MSEKINLLNLNQQELEEFVVSWNEKILWKTTF